ncbi:small ribosomal subunit Rsm22 family protein [Streptomyces meridianus]|uniref:Small ribosomal subunit Rsm22 family protein n=1 Tax=Streptomyces meridianus TaxID=2938945 RepID=A0ABT0XC93_9ACTN|nr:small ribosomal subunit Rsm22 family protein [Streptomyces meridianus]MCM2579347.1 small ribosomal subunit Rsm22 family protein [Streptomyces meridianus]
MHTPDTGGTAPALPVRDALRTALAGLLDGLPPRQAVQAVDRLIANYRGTTPTDAPVLRDRADAVAYAAYRMPATFEAVRSALAAFRAAEPDRVPAAHVDLGGGTGAASWAVADAWPAGKHTTTVLDWAEPALGLGRELAVRSGPAPLRDARWQRQALGAGTALPEGCDLVTLCYVLGELTEPARHAVVDAAAATAEVVLVVEPGTPEGYLRVIAARDRLIGAGFRIAAPCPHSRACPIEPGSDWCHFAARVNRSSLHRQVKGGSLPYEDEKFSYVAAVRSAAHEDAQPGPRARVVRRPQLRKGQVLLDLCLPEQGLGRETVTKRRGALYRAARDTEWGAAWPPPDQD